MANLAELPWAEARMPEGRSMSSTRTARVTGTIIRIVAFGTMDRDAIGVYSSDSSKEDRGDRIAMR